MAEEQILCHQCGKDLVMKFIEVKDLVFCSNQCIEQFINFLPGEGKGWVPRYANDYVMMCTRCPKKLYEVCQEEMGISGACHDILAESEARHWCCHARFCLSSACSDAEKKSEKQEMRGVTTVALSQSFADLLKNFDYQRLPENPPEVKQIDMSHVGACLLCDEAFGRQCESQVEREFQLLDKAKSLVQNLWCGHTVNVLADILIDRENGEELAGKVIPVAEKVAQEKKHPGVITRDLFIALGRMV
jgi:hypothetical protein